jgi:hypothetical protein
LGKYILRVDEGGDVEKDNGTLSEWEKETRGIIRRALRKPLKILRERHRNIEVGLVRQTKQMEILKEKERDILLNANNNMGPLVAINMLAVEALFLLNNRTTLNRPKHYKIIHKALTIVEQYTYSDMDEAVKGVVYGPDKETLAILHRLSDKAR